MDEDDEFLYGEQSQPDTAPAPSDFDHLPSQLRVNYFRAQTVSLTLSTTKYDVNEHRECASVSLEHVQASNGLVQHLENEAIKHQQETSKEQEADDDEEDEVDLGEESDEDDVEIIMEPVARSLDFRAQNKHTPTRPAASSTPSHPKAPQPSLTTEYTPISRGGPPGLAPSQNHPETTPSASIPTRAQPSSTQPPQTSVAPQSGVVDDGIDTSTLPPATAPPSHPTVDVEAPGIFDGRSILELDINALGDKPWRRPGSDISDWFNYGFDEISWEAYCYRRRDLGEIANVLKTNVINFSATPEDQLLALPPELRTMVMTGANAMMNNASANQGMMPGVMMDMSGMMGPMGMGMNGDMGMGNAMMQGMMQDGAQVQQGVNVGVVPNSGTPEQVNGVNMIQDGFNPAAAGMMNMGMGGEFMQEQNPMVQPIYPVMEQQNVAPVSSGRGTPIPFRGRSTPGLGGRARGFPPRGRGRGYGGDAPVSVPVRPASPLPPGVPTGPRNQNKYKDRDGNAPAVDGLDYGGGKEGGISRRTPSGEPEERISRKRRSSPGLDDIRSSKRR